MKILICTGIYPPDIGGPATYSNLIREELERRGHEVSILTYGEIANNKLRITSISRKYPLIVRYFFYFWRVLKLGKTADVIYVQDPVSAGLPTALANLFLRKKFILKIVGDYAWEQAMQTQNAELRVQNLDNFYPFNKEHSFKIKLLQKIQAWVANGAGKIITPSFYLKNILTRGWGISEDKIRVIYNAFSISSSVIPAQAGIPRHQFKISSVGRIVAWKGFDVLVDVVKEIESVELEIIGEGPEMNNLKNKVNSLKLEDRIKLSGRNNHDEVVQKMCSSDLFILNSSYEGLSHVILEAMVCGLPVAVSRAGGNMELTGENEDRGYLFEYNNKEQIKEKINYIISHHEEAREKAKKARDFVAGFSKDKMIEKLEAELKG
ncbi:MAG: glycosyltransferase family 4 protein [Patescibacteria group bacterium]